MKFHLKKPLKRKRESSENWPENGIFYSKSYGDPVASDSPTALQFPLWYTRRSVLLDTCSSLISRFNTRIFEKSWLQQQSVDLQISKTSAIDRFDEMGLVDSTPVVTMDIDSTENLYLLTGASSGTIDLYSLEAESDSVVDSFGQRIVKPMSRIRRSADAHTKSITDIQWFPFHNGLFGTSSADSKLIIWDTNRLQQNALFNLHSKVHSLSFSTLVTSDSSLLVACGLDDGTIRLCDIRTNSSAHTIVAHHSATRAAKWSPHHFHQLASASNDGTIKIWDVRRSQSCVAVLDSRDAGQSGSAADRDESVSGHFELGTAHGGPVNGLEFGIYEDYLYSVGLDSQIRKWDMLTFKNTLVNFGSALVNTQRNARLQLCVSDNPAIAAVPTLVAPCETGALLVYDTRSGRLLQTVRAHFKAATAVVAQPQITHYQYLSSSQDGLIVSYLPRKFNKSVTLGRSDPAVDLLDDWSD